MGDAPQCPAAGDAADGPVRRARKANPLANRIKRLMQTDEDVGKIAQAAPALIGRALELFLGRLCSGANAVAQQHYANQLSAGHLKAAVAAEPMLDFLKDAVSEAPDLPPPPDKPPARRQRKKTDAAGEGDGGAEAAAPRQRKPRARKRKAASDEDTDEEDAAAAAEASDPDYSDDSGAARKRKRKQKAAPRKPRAAKSAAAGASGGRAAAGRRAKPREPADSDVDLSDAEDVAAGAEHGVRTSAVAAGGAQQTATAAAPPDAADAHGWHAVADPYGALPTDPPIAAAAPVVLGASMPQAAATDATPGSASATRQPDNQQASLPEAAAGQTGNARLPDDAATTAAAGLPASILSSPLAAMLPVEEDDYDAE